MESFARLSSSALLNCVFLDLLSEVPLMTFRVLRAVATVTIELIFRFLQDGCSCFPGACKMLVYIVYVDMEALRRLPQPLRVLIF